MKLLLITNYASNQPPGGRAQLCSLTRSALDELLEGRLLVELVERVPVQGFGSAGLALLGYIDGLNSVVIARILRRIEREDVSHVFVDGSNLGLAVRAIKRRFPKVSVISFFHNIEARFFLGMFRQRPTLRSLAVAVANFVAERAAVRVSDILVSLNDRDSAVMHSWYGRKASVVSALSVRSRPSKKSDQDFGVLKIDKPFVLFVGGAFYANVDAVRWYCRFIAPTAPIRLLVVGRGFEEFAAEFTVPGRVEVVGAVEDLLAFYARCKFVVAPIFDGSGMKTKVAEALMYGKRVLGTPEAFCGYEQHLPRAGWCASTSGEFLELLTQCARTEFPLRDEQLVEVFQQHYSFEAMRSRLGEILKSAGLPIQNFSSPSRVAA